MVDRDYDEDIDSVIEYSDGKSDAKFPECDIEPDEWYLAEIAKITAVPNKHGNKNYRWFFELQDEKFVVDWGGKKKRHSIMGTTSTLLSPNTRLYEWYCKITGVEGLNKGEKISVKKLIGMQCYIMVIKTKRTDGKYPYYINVDKIKSVKKSTKPVTKSSVPFQVDNPGGVKKPSDIKMDDFTQEENDIFKDIQ